MASPKQIAANKRNALKSTGPKSVNGKKFSRVNAVKHGALANLVLVNFDGYHEDPESFAHLHTALCQDFDPFGVAEENEVANIAVCYLRKTRVWRAERAVICDGMTALPVWDSPAPIEEDLIDDPPWDDPDFYDGPVELGLADGPPRNGEASSDAPSAPPSQSAPPAQSPSSAVPPATPAASGRSWPRLPLNFSALVPYEPRASAFTRYEAHLDRSIDRSLNRLLMLQRRRAVLVAPLRKRGGVGGGVAARPLALPPETRRPRTRN